MDKKVLYDKWVAEVCQYIDTEGWEINCPSCAMQSKPVLDKSPQVIFLGYNANEPGVYDGVNRNRFYEGNPAFYTSSRQKFTIWQKLYRAMGRVDYVEPMEDGNFVFMNAVYFGSRNIRELQAKKRGKCVINKCLDFTAKAIRDIYQPKAVVCFSIPNCFNPIVNCLHIDDAQRFKPNTIEGNSAKCFVAKAMWNGIKILGIPHPSGRISTEDWGVIALFLKNELSNK